VHHYLAQVRILSKHGQLELCGADQRALNRVTTIVVSRDDHVLA
jgi:hypothetical protein